MEPTNQSDSQHVVPSPFGPEPRRYVVRWTADGRWHEQRFGTATGAEEYRDLLRGSVDPNAYAARS